MRVCDLLKAIDEIYEGDNFFLEFNDTLVETHVVGFTSDGVILAADDNVMNYLSLDEAEYHGRQVPLGKPMRGDVKKSKVFVRDPKTGNIKKVNFGDKKLSIKKHLPNHRKSFRARHHCKTPGPRTKARYWSCRAWE